MLSPEPQWEGSKEELACSVVWVAQVSKVLGSLDNILHLNLKILFCKWNRLREMKQMTQGHVSTNLWS